MSLNVCINQGYLGKLQITPNSYSTNKSSDTVKYTITIQPDLSNIVEISGEVNISGSSSLQTGVFDFQFTQQQISLYSISKKQNGFTFIVNSQTVESFNSEPLNFNLKIFDFYNNY